MQLLTSRVRRVAAMVAASAAVAIPAGAQAQATQSGSAAFTPAVGQPAPDFTGMATDSTGRAIPVSLAQYRGRVVVLAFYPADRSSGCTIELSKFRDDYAKLFGQGTVVLPTSVDSIGSHASWAKDAHFPFAMIADTAGAIAKQYSSAAPGRRFFRRTTFVIGKDGAVAYADPRFNPNSQDSYDKLEAAIKSANAK